MNIKAIGILSSYADIAVNLTDPMFKGIYRGKQNHANDFIQVLARSKAAGVESMIITGNILIIQELRLVIAKKL